VPAVTFRPFFGATGTSIIPTIAASDVWRADALSNPLMAVTHDLKELRGTRPEGTRPDNRPLF
jgi:hypothetical protein